MKKKLVIIMLLATMNCVFSELREPKMLGNYTVISKTGAEPTVTSETKVTGEHCRYINLYSGPHPQLELAIQDALTKSPAGSKGLKDVSVNANIANGLAYIGILFPIYFFVGGPLQHSCYTVEGTPAR